MQNMAHKTVCFTGHRHIPYYDREDLLVSLRAEVKRQILSGARIFRAGGALGFDTMAAQTVLELRRVSPQIELELILPCPSQTDGWQEQDKRIYNEILAQADRACYVSQFYFNGLLQLRNRKLVEGSDVCIAYLRGSHGGGTAYTTALAIRSGLEYINLFERVGWEDYEISRSKCLKLLRP